MSTTTAPDSPTAVPKSSRARKAKAADRAKAARSAANLLKQVSDPTRLQALILLADGPLNVGALTSAIGVGQPALSHHLAIARHGRLVEPTRLGKENHYSLTERGRRLVECVRGLVGVEV